MRERDRPREIGMAALDPDRGERRVDARRIAREREEDRGLGCGEDDEHPSARAERPRDRVDGPARFVEGRETVPLRRHRRGDVEHHRDRRAPGHGGPTDGTRQGEGAERERDRLEQQRKLGSQALPRMLRREIAEDLLPEQGRADGALRPLLLQDVEEDERPEQTEEEQVPRSEEAHDAPPR